MKASRAQHPDPSTASLPVEVARIAKLEAENHRLEKGQSVLSPRSTSEQDLRLDTRREGVVTIDLAVSAPATTPGANGSAG